jgi:polyisoprenoid-binding protein YceI
MITRKAKLIIGGGVALVAALVLAAGAIYYMVVPHDTPAPATLRDAVASLENASTQAPNGEVASVAVTGTAAASTQGNGLAGTWVLAADGTSFVGYRVREQLAGIGTATAVGRTQQLTATLVFDGRAITDVRVTADLSMLRSDNSMRDGQLKRQALETATYPMAAFQLTQPIALDGVAAEGETIAATAVGDLTLHGVTRGVSLSLQGQLTHGRVVVVGSLDIPFADFGIQQPSSGMVLGVEDHGLLELQLVFQQGSQG